MRKTYWSEEQVNIGLARRAWSHYYIPWSLRGDLHAYFKPLFDSCAEDVLWIHEGPVHPRVPTFPGVIRGKAALIHAFTVEDLDVCEDNELEDPAGKPLEFIGSGNHVVVLVEERYRIPRTGADVRNNLAAVLMSFSGGLITHMRAYGNLSEHIESMLGVGWTKQSE